MPRVILTWILLIWISFSVLSIVMILLSFFSPHWLQRMDSVETRRLISCPSPGNPGSLNHDTNPSDVWNSQSSLNYPTIGPWIRCQTVCSNMNQMWSLSWKTEQGTLTRCQLALWGFGNRPAKANALSWAASSIGLAGCILLLVSTHFVFLTLCKREICDRSLLSFTGSIMGIADLFLLTSVILWPTGWDSVTIREVCGGSVGPYSKGSCTIGWAPLTTICGMFLLFFNAILAVKVDKSITTKTATRKSLMNGKTCVFIH